MDRQQLIAVLTAAMGEEKFDWYADSVNGNDANAGTSRGAALKTLSALVGKTIAAGQKVGLTGTFRETLTVPSSGTAGSRITYKSYGGRATISGADIATTWETAGYDISTIAGFVTALGGDAVVQAIYDTRYGITTSSNVVDAWDDARGAAGYGPQLTAATTTRPAWDNTNKLITFDGSNDHLISAAFTGFNLNTTKTLIIISSGAATAWRGFVCIRNAAGTRYAQIVRLAGTTYSGEAYNGTGANPRPDSGVATSTTRRLVYFQHKSGNDTLGASIAVSDAAAVAATSILNTTDDYLMDVSGFNSNDRWAAQIVRAVLVIEGNLSSTQIALLQAWAYNQHAAVMESAAAVSDPSNIWQSTVAATPKQVYKDGVRATKGASAITLTDGQWFASGTTLYFNNAAGNPDTAGIVIEASVRDNDGYYNGGDYVTLDNLHVTKANLYGINIGASDHTIDGSTVQNCLTDYNYDVGIFSWVPTSNAGLTQILSCETAYNGLQAGVDGTTAAHVGLEILGSNATYGTLVEWLNSHHNYWGAELDQGSENTTLLFSNIHDNSRMGLNIDNSHHNLVAYCLITNNGDLWGLRIWSATDQTLTDNRLYNLTIAGQGSGILIEDKQVDLKVKNNIIYNPTGLCLSVDAVAVAQSTGLEIDYNCYWKVGADPQMWSWNGTVYTKSQFATYQAASGQDAHSVCADPLFVSASDFHLQAGSPCINAGVSVALTADYAGVAVGNPPEIGAYEY